MGSPRGINVFFSLINGCCFFTTQSQPGNAELLIGKRCRYAINASILFIQQVNELMKAYILFIRFVFKTTMQGGLGLNHFSFHYTPSAYHAGDGLFLAVVTIE